MGIGFSRVFPAGFQPLFSGLKKIMTNKVAWSFLPASADLCRQAAASWAAMASYSHQGQPIVVNPGAARQSQQYISKHTY